MNRVKMIFSMLVLLLLSAVAMAEVFRWTDESGQQHFSDHRPAQTSEDAELVAPELYHSPPVGWQGTTSLPATPTRPARDASTNASDNQSGTAYYSQLRVQEPANDATFWSAPGEVQVVLGLNPPLRETDRILIYLDGAPQGEGFAETSVSLQNIDRGTHSISAAVIDAAGRVLLQSATHSFHLHRPTSR